MPVYASEPNGAELATALDDSLQQHFETLQAISDRQALEDLLPRLKNALFETTNFDSVREAIRSATGETAVQLKLQRWRDLSTLCFTRTMSATWLTPLLDLLVRMKLHIVGRHMYLESKLPELHLAGRSPPVKLALPPRLTDAAKEAFFNCDHFVEHGAALVIEQMSRAVIITLNEVDFQSEVTPAELDAMTTAAHARFEAGLAAANLNWPSLLLPPTGEELGRGGLYGGGLVLTPVERGMVDELSAELRDVLGSARFVEALRAAVKQASRVTHTYICSKFSTVALDDEGGPCGASSPAARPAPPPASPRLRVSSGGVPPSPLSAAGSAGRERLYPPVGSAFLPKQFAYAVPIVAKACNPLFDGMHSCTRSISSLPPVQALSASVFACGPHLL